MKRYTPAYYFPTFARLTVLTQGIILGLMWSVFFVFQLGLSWGVLVGMGVALLHGLGMAWWLAWMASRRKPLASLQEARGLFAWRYIDLAASYEEVRREAKEVLRSLSILSDVVDVQEKGMLVASTRSTLWTWGSEVTVQVEALSPTDTRVQVLSRPLIPSNIMDFGANKKIVNRIVGKLKVRYAVLAEG